MTAPPRWSSTAISSPPLRKNGSRGRSTIPVSRTRDPVLPRRRVARYDDIDYVAFYEKPLRKFDRLIETYLSFAPAGLGSFGRRDPVVVEGKAPSVGRHP